MGLFGLFERKKQVTLDNAKSEHNKALMRQLFDQKVAKGADYQIVYGYSEDIGGANFLVIRTVSYKYRSFILGYNERDLSLVFLEVSPDLTSVGAPLIYTPEDVKKAHYTSMVGSYYLQYGSAFKKEFFNFFVPETIDDIVNHNWYDEETFPYVDQREEHQNWVNFWNNFSKK